MAYPHRRRELSDMVQSHAQDDDGPLVLALYYNDPEQSSVECVFEVFQNYNQKRIDPDKDMLSVQFNPASAWPIITDGDALRITITNPIELVAAVEEHWASLQPVLEAIENNQYEALEITEEGTSILDQLSRRPTVA